MSCVNVRLGAKKAPRVSWPASCDSAVVFSGVLGILRGQFAIPTVTCKILVESLHSGD